MADDKIQIEILADGTLKITTDQISPANHKQADELIKTIMTLGGGTVLVQKRKQAHTHTHQHGHEHA